MRFCLFVAVGLGLGACSSVRDDRDGSDAGGGDDAGTTDAGDFDSGSDDAGSDDAGSDDAGSDDAGPTEPVCGDGTVEGDEVCDDGNSDDGDLCPGDCTLAPVKVGAGWAHACALLSDGRVFCWGDNAQQELGNGDDSGTDSDTPVEVEVIDDAIDLAVGLDHGCVVRAGGEIWCWGYNNLGQLGDDTIVSRATPVQAMLPSGFEAVEVTAGRRHSCARSDAGAVACWGSNEFGQLGVHPDDLDPLNYATTPQEVAGVTAEALATANGTTCIIDADGDVYCWGYNANGQLGTDSTAGVHSFTPVQIAGLPADATLLGMGHQHLCARVGESLYCWGWNDHGQLGDGTTTSSGIPVETDLPAIDAAGGGSHTCMILEPAPHQLRCWGLNADGELGDATTDTRAAPVTVVEPSGTGALTEGSSIAGGFRHTCAVADHVLYCWGRNDSGQLGNDETGGDAFGRDVPTPVTVTW